MKLEKSILVKEGYVEFLINLLDMSIAASYLVIVIAIFRLIFRKVPKFINCIIWALVGIRLILPVSFDGIISLFPHKSPMIEEAVYFGRLASAKTSQLIEKTVTNTLQNVVAIEGSSQDTPVNMFALILLVVWIMGMVVMLLYSVITYIHIYNKAKVSVRYRDNIYVGDYIDSPFILGIVRPKIYIPTDLSGEGMECVILHEKAHIKRHDNWWKFVGFLLLIVHWFNPILWVAYLMFCRDIEFACDEKVIKSLGCDRRQAYAQVLLEYSIPRYMLVAYPVAFGEVGVKMRIKSILNYKKPTFWAIVAAVVVCIGVGIAFITNPLSLNASDDPEEHGRYEDYSGEKKFVYKDKKTGIEYTISLTSGDIGDYTKEFKIKTNNSAIEEITGTWELSRGVLYLYTYDPGNNKICYVFNKGDFNLTFDKEKSPYAPPVAQNADELFEKAVFEQTEIKWIYY